MKKKTMKNMITIGIVVALVAVVFSSMYIAGFILPQTTEEIIIDTRDGSSFAKWLVQYNDVIAQKIIVPTGVVYLRRAGFSGATRLFPGYPCNVICGISLTLTTNENNWLKKSTVSIGSNFEIDLTVTSGQTYYLMMKAATSGSYGAFWYQPTQPFEYAEGTCYFTDGGSTLQDKGCDAKFFLQGVIDLGMTFEILSAGAYPDHISAGGTSQFIASIRSPTGGTCNVILYKNYDTKVVWESRAETFTQNQQKTVTFTKVNIPAGTYPMAIECNVGGVEEAHKKFTLYVEGGASTHPPNTPSLSGIGSLKTGVTGHWQAVATDPDSDTIRYIWTVDGGQEEVTGYYPSGVSDGFSYTFSVAGTHIIGVKAEDSGGLSSGWMTKTVQVSSDEPPPSNQYSVQISVVNSVTYDSIVGAKVQNGMTMYTNDQGIASGVFSPGTYSFTITKTGFETEYLTVVVSSSEVSETVYMMPSDGPEEPPEEPPDEEDTYSIFVQVYNSRTSNPVDNALIIIGNEVQFTDSTGLATFIREPGTYTVSISQTGYHSDEQSVTVFSSDENVFSYLVETDAGEAEPPGIPGFETLSLVVALGIAFILLKRRKKNQ